MKNRKLWIISFLVVATVVTGVGFAALTGSLDVTGSAKFIGSGMADTEVRNAINFTAVKAGDYAVAVLTDTDSNGYSKTADMTVEFHDLDGSTLGSEYTAYADFTITYGVQGELLPEMTLCSLDRDSLEEHKATVTMTDNGTISGDFDVEAYWVDEEGTNLGKEKKTLTAGQSVIMRVVVTYVEDDEGDHPQDSFTSAITVFVPFHTVDNTSDGDETLEQGGGGEG